MVKKTILGKVIEVNVVVYAVNGALNFALPVIGQTNPLAGVFADPTVILVTGVLLTGYAIDYIAERLQGKALIK